jgi:hypothetical protein
MGSPLSDWSFGRALTTALSVGAPAGCLISNTEQLLVRTAVVLKPLHELSRQGAGLALLWLFLRVKCYSHRSTFRVIAPGGNVYKRSTLTFTAVFEPAVAWPPVPLS